MIFSLRPFKTLALTCLVMGASSALAVHAYADCATRHFYNNGIETFVLSMGSSAGSCTIGNSPMQRVCYVPLGAVAEIHYGNNSSGDYLAGAANGLARANGDSMKNFSEGDRDIAVAPADADPATPSQDFSVDTSSCHINHSGNTGYLVLNDPADGDIKVTCVGKCAAVVSAVGQTLDQVKRALQH